MADHDTWHWQEAGMTFRVMDKIQVGARSAPTFFFSL